MKTNHFQFLSKIGFLEKTVNVKPGIINEYVENYPFVLEIFKYFGRRYWISQILGND